MVAPPRVHKPLLCVTVCMASLDAWLWSFRAPAVLVSRVSLVAFQVATREYWEYFVKDINILKANSGQKPAVLVMSKELQDELTTSWRACRYGCKTWTSSCWMRRIACWTWASNRRSGRFWWSHLARMNGWRGDALFYLSLYCCIYSIQSIHLLIISFVYFFYFFFPLRLFIHLLMYLCIYLFTYLFCILESINSFLISSFE